LYFDSDFWLNIFLVHEILIQLVEAERQDNELYSGFTGSIRRVIQRPDSIHLVQFRYTRAKMLVDKADEMEQKLEPSLEDSRPERGWPCVILYRGVGCCLIHEIVWSPLFISLFANFIPRKYQSMAR
jgi:hypothetical protein